MSRMVLIQAFYTYLDDDRLPRNKATTLPEILHFTNNLDQVVSNLWDMTLWGWMTFSQGYLRPLEKTDVSIMIHNSMIQYSYEVAT